jgi:hypothetical protein
MVKILGGVVAVIAIAAGGFFGFEFYIQHGVTSEIEAAFDQIRATGGKASHGKVSFDLLSRTVTVADIAGQSAEPAPVNVKIASFTASVVSQPDAARFFADSIDITDIEIDVAMAAQPAMNLVYKVPRITAKDYSGPASLQRPPASSSIVEIYRFAFEQFAGITAASITAPSVAGTIDFGGAMPGGGDFAYSGLAMQGINDGKIAGMKVDGFAFTIGMQPPTGKADKLTASLANLAADDIDINAMAAIFDPQKANDDQYHRAYRHISAGPYVVTSGQGMNMRIEGMTIDDAGFRPSRLQLPALMAMIPAPGAASPTPAHARDLMDKVASLYEGMRVGNAEMHGFSIETPRGPIKLSTVRVNLDNGKINEFAIEGLDTRTPMGPVKVARFALKSIDIANLIRMAALFSNPAQQSSPDKTLGLIPLIEGVELKGIVAPLRDTGKAYNVDTFSLEWGQFVGPIPSKVRLKLKMSAPLDSSDPRQQMLLGAGLDTAAIDLDVGAAWTEASKSFALEPVSLEFGGLLKASARVSLSSVPRGLFSPNLTQATAVAAEIEAGTLEFTMHDSGFLDLANALMARVLNVSREEERRTFVDKIRDGGRRAAATKPDAAVAAEALASFIETPGQSLTVKLTPIGKVPALQFIELFKGDPDNANALAQFRIDASTGL